MSLVNACRRPGCHWLFAVALIVVMLLGATAGSSAGASRGTVVVPRTGSDVLTAYARLHKAGLRVSIPHAWSYDTRRPPKVIRLSPAPGRRVRRGSVVTLTLGCCGRSRAPHGRIPKAFVPPFVTSAASVAYSWVARKAEFKAHLSPLRAGNTSGLLLNYRVTRQSPAPNMLLAPLSMWGTQAAPCAPPPGSRLVASNRDAVLTSRVHRPPDIVVTSRGYYGCLRTAGAVQWLIDNYDFGDETQLVKQAALSGRFAAFALRDTNHYGECRASVVMERIDAATPVAQTTVFGESAKPGTVFGGYCRDDGLISTAPGTGIDSLQLNSRGFSAWRDTYQISPLPLSAVSCPSSSLCVALDSAGNAITSSDPLGGQAAWTSTRIDPSHTPTDLSCPSASLCVAADIFGIITSTDPLGGQAAWTSAAIGQSRIVTAVSCPSVSLCVAGGPAGSVLTSTNPTGGAAAWTETRISGMESGLGHVSCPSVSLCVATDGAGDVVTSTNPTGGPGAWTVTPVTAKGRSLGAISCPSTTLCVAGEIGGPTGHVFTSTNPTGGSAAWIASQIPAASTVPLGYLSAISCPSTSLCVAGEYAGNLLSTTNPAGGGPAWSVTPGRSGTRIAAISCPSPSFCIAARSDGSALMSTMPTAGFESWSSTLIDPPAPTCSDPQTCLVSKIYARDSHGTRLLDPGVPGSSKSVTNLKLVGNVLTWQSSGAPRQATLH